MSTTKTCRARARTATLVAAGVLAVGVAVGAVLALGPDDSGAGEPAAATSPTATTTAMTGFEPVINGSNAAAVAAAEAYAAAHPGTLVVDITA